MRVVAYMTVWKRPEVFEFCLKHYTENHLYPIVCGVSSDDPYFERQVEICMKYKVDWCVVENKPLGKKANELIDYCIGIYNPDYLLKVDSDDIINPDIWKPYELLMEIGAPFFGVTDILMVHADLKDTRLVEYPMVCGAAKMISVKLLDKLEYYYRPEVDSGLDTSMEGEVRRRTGIIPAQVPGVYVMDIKTATNISTWEVMSKRIYTKSAEPSEYFKHYIDQLNIVEG